MTNKPKEGGVGPPVSNEAKKPKKKNQKKKQKVKPTSINLTKRVTNVRGAADGYYAYQDDVKEEDPIKERHLSHTMEFIVGNIATPNDVATGNAGENVDKGVAVYFIPPAKNTLGTFVGKKEVSSEFHNDSDQTIVIAGGWCKNWSDDIEVIDTVEPFRLEIPPMSSRKTSCKKQWNWPMFSADTAQSIPARYLMMRYYVHSSDAWSEKYKATSLVDEGGTPVLDTEMKNVTAYRRVDSIHYYTTGGATDDEAATNLMGHGTFYEFADIHLINGTKPFPPTPYKMQEMTGRIAGTNKKISFFGHPPQGYVESDMPVYQDVIVNLSGTEKVGLGVYPVDYYDEKYGWGGMLMLCTISKQNIADDTAPEPWKNTYTTPDMSGNSHIEWELPALGSLTLDEVNDDMASVAGRYKYSEAEGCYVLWDYMRNQPSLIGSGYNSFKGDYIFYAPKCFTGPKTVIKGVIPGSFKRDQSAAPQLKITWGAVFAVVSTIIEVLYVASQALGHHFKGQKDMLKFTDPAAYLEEQEKITKDSTSKLNAFLEQQEKDYGKLRPRHHGQPEREGEEGGRRRR